MTRNLTSWDRIPIRDPRLRDDPWMTPPPRRKARSELCT